MKPFRDDGKVLWKMVGMYTLMVFFIALSAFMGLNWYRDHDRLVSVQAEVQPLRERNKVLEGGVTDAINGRQYEALKAGNLSSRVEEIEQELVSTRQKMWGFQGSTKSMRVEGCRLESILRDNGFKIRSQQLACHKLSKGE